MATTAQPVDILPRRLAPLRELVAGVDGGGTRTRAVVLDVPSELSVKARLAHRDPLRVGVSNGVTAIRDAIDRACGCALIHRDDLVAVGIGLAGVRRKDIRDSHARCVWLRPSESTTIEIVSDGDIRTLRSHGRRNPAWSLISGTGSISVGVNRHGKRVHAGGWGQSRAMSSGSWIARTCAADGCARE